MKMKFYRCSICGQIIAMVEETGVPVICCGEPMEELTPQTNDMIGEKHIPVCERKDGIVHVTVGSVEHPMLDKHYIEWIVLQTSNGHQMARLKPGMPPKACFALCGDEKVEAVYAYCNVHSLWMA